MDEFLWWSGVAAWGIAGAFIWLLALNHVFDYALQTLKMKRAFLEWAFERGKAKRQSHSRGA